MRQGKLILLDIDMLRQQVENDPVHPYKILDDFLLPV